MHSLESMTPPVSLTRFCCCSTAKLMAYNSYNSYFKGKDKILVNLPVNCHSIHIVFYCSVAAKLRKIKIYFFLHLLIITFLLACKSYNILQIPSKWANLRSTAAVEIICYALINCYQMQ